MLALTSLWPRCSWTVQISKHRLADSSQRNSRSRSATNHRGPCTKHSGLGIERICIAPGQVRVARDGQSCYRFQPLGEAIQETSGSGTLEPSFERRSAIQVQVLGHVVLKVGDLARRGFLQRCSGNPYRRPGKEVCHDLFLSRQPS